ncbi:MAG: PHP domain-containing protein [Candidatus Aenigmarchaeota archaeon]|nr:PHP domain-containing protein [Candidatus Aenigmarchaeota archaeon]
MPKEKWFKADFHIHSHFSPDSDMTPEDILKAVKRLKFDIIAVTDHNTIKGGIETKKLAENEGMDVKVVVGSEIKTKDGEVIGLNIKKEIPKNLSLIETCKRIKKQDGFLIIPHPFDKMRKGVGDHVYEIMKYIDAVEVFNARTLFTKFNRDAYEFAYNNNLPSVAGSDSHFSFEIGSAYTLIKARNIDDIFASIKRGFTKIKGRKTGLLPHLKTFTTRFGKRFNF